MSRRGREIALAVAVVAGLVAVVLRPLPWRAGSLPRYVGRTAPFDNADRNLNAWILAWTARAAQEDPGHLFDGNIYYPARNTLAGSETMLAHLPVTAPVWRATRDSTWVLKAEMAWGIGGTGLAVFLLARLCGIAPWAALVAAAAVALEPGRINSLGTGNGLAAQPQYLGFQYAPLALCALGVWAASGPRAGRARLFGLAAALALSLALQALACFYLGYYAFLTVPIAGAWLVWRARPRGELVALAASVAGGALLVLPVALQYLAARRAGAVRSPDAELAWLGSLAGAGFAAGAAWIGPLGLALGAIGLAAAIRRAPDERSGRIRAPLVEAAWVLALVAFTVALGPELRVGGRSIPLPHAWLAAVVPGFAMLRGPIRALSFVTLGGALAGSAALSQAGTGWRRGPRAAFAATGVAVALVWLAATPVPIERAPLGVDLPEVYRWLAAEPHEGGVLEVPGAAAEEDLAGLVRESRYMLFSTTHWQSLVNGYTAYPPVWGELAKSLARRLPERDALQTLVNLLPLRRVIVHRGALPDPARAAWDALDENAGLVPAERFADDVAYDVTLPAKADWRSAVDAPPSAVTLEGGSTAPLPEPCRRGAIEANLPTDLRVALAVRAIPVRVSNASDCLWPGLAVRPEGLVTVTATWPDAPPAILPPPIRARLPHDLAPGAHAALDALVLSPRLPGTYRLRLTLAQQGEPEAIAALERTVVVAPALARRDPAQPGDAAAPPGAPAGEPPAGDAPSAGPPGAGATE